VFAFGVSVIGLALGVAIVVVYSRRRPAGAHLTWGEALVAAAFVYFMMDLAYGIVPNQWLAYADNELQWRADKILVGVGGLVAKLPFTVTYVVLRDLVAVLIYAIGLGGQIYLWSMWQNRGKAKPKEIPASAYGRPLVKSA